MTKMKRTIAVVVAAAGLVLTSGAAQALNTVDLVWRTNLTEIGTPTVSASSIIIADVILTADSAGVSGFGITVTFDPAELQYVSGQEFTSVNAPGMGNIFVPLAIGVTVDNTAGVISGFDQADLAGLGVVSGTRTLGSFKFHVLNPVDDNTDIDLFGNTAGGSDGLVDSLGNGLPSPTFNGAAVTGPPPVPEPTTAVLLLAGLVGLGYAGRRSLR